MCGNAYDGDYEIKYYSTFGGGYWVYFTKTCNTLVFKPQAIDNYKLVLYNFKIGISVIMRSDAAA